MLDDMTIPPHMSHPKTPKHHVTQQQKVKSVMKMMKSPEAPMQT